jgi:hypothetical protein
MAPSSLSTMTALFSVLRKGGFEFPDAPSGVA